MSYNEELFTQIATKEQDEFQNKILQNRYKIQKELGRGGMGIVYQANDLLLKRKVALKIIINADEEQKKRFALEIESLAKLSHPNLVKLYDSYSAPDYFFVMELIEGYTLSQIISKQKLPIKKTIQLLIKIAFAVEYIHGKKIIHRDIKPENIMVTKNGEAKIMDFGLVKVESIKTSNTGDILGTPKYMSPEQASSKKIDKRTDVYSLGATLYEICTESPPFQADGYVQTLLQVIEKDPIPPKDFNPEISSDLEAICLKSLEKNPSHRYPSAIKFAEDLENFLQDLPIKAKKISKLRHAKKFIRRNRTICSLVGIIFLMVIFSISIYLLNQEKLIQAERKKRKQTTIAFVEAKKAEAELKKTLLLLEKEISKLNKEKLISNKGILLKKEINKKSEESRRQLIHRQYQAQNASKSIFRVLKKIYDENETVRYSNAFLKAIKHVFIELERFKIFHQLLNSDNDPDGILSLYGDMHGFNSLSGKKIESQFYTFIIKKNPQPWMYFHRSIILMKQKKYKEALDDLKIFAQMAPLKIHKYYAMRGKLCQFVDELKKAEYFFSKAIEKKPESLWCYNARAKFYEQQKQYNLAEKDYLKIIELNPKNKMTYFSLYKILNIQNKPKKLEKILNKALEIFIDDQVFLFQRGLVLLAQEKLLKAKQDFSDVIKISPKSENAYYHRAYINTKFKKYDLAQKDLKKAIQLNNNLPYLYFLRIAVYSRQKKYIKAKKLALKSVKKYPENLQLHLVLAESYSKLKKYKKALYHLEKIIKQSPKSSLALDAYSFKIAIYYKQKEKKKARSEYQKLLKINKGFGYFAKANLYALEKQVKACIKNLKLAMKNGHPSINNVEFDSDFDYVKRDERFKAFLKKYTDSK